MAKRTLVKFSTPSGGVAIIDPKLVQAIHSGKRIGNVHQTTIILPGGQMAVACGFDEAVFRLFDAVPGHDGITATEYGYVTVLS